MNPKKNHIHVNDQNCIKIPKEEFNMCMGMTLTRAFLKKNNNLKKKNRK